MKTAASNTFKLIALGVVSCALTACGAAFGPSSMPTGYKYHHTEYRSAGGPNPIMKTWEEWTDANQPLMQTSVPFGTVVAPPPPGMFDPMTGQPMAMVPGPAGPAMMPVGSAAPNPYAPPMPPQAFNPYAPNPYAAPPPGYNPYGYAPPVPPQFAPPYNPYAAPPPSPMYIPQQALAQQSPQAGGPAPGMPAQRPPMLLSP